MVWLARVLDTSLIKKTGDANKSLLARRFRAINMLRGRILEQVLPGQLSRWPTYLDQGARDIVFELE